MATRRTRRGFREVQQPFVAATGLADLFAAYGHACAFTGQGLTREAAADPRGYLLSLGDDTATTDSTLLIPACLDAIHAYERGHLAVGPRYNFLADLERIDPELLERLNPIGRLRLPDGEAFRPSLQALAVHRAAFAAGAFSAD